jgi:large subunit ribosomal protein L29
MKASELRQMSADEMLRKADDLKQELFNLRFQQTINQMEKPHKMKQTRRDIARIKTIIRETDSKK